MEEIGFQQLITDWRFFIPLLTLLAGCGILIVSILNLRKKFITIPEITDDEALLFKDYKGHELAYYWGERKKGDDTLRKNLLNAKHDVFISGIALRTLSNILNSGNIQSHIAHNINEINSTFKITVVACDSPQNAKRLEIGNNELLARINEGKNNLTEFKNGVVAKLINEKVDRNGNCSSMKFFNYPDEVVPRHFIIKIDDFLYVGSYLHSQEGKKSYMIRLKKNAIEKNSDYNGLYSLFHKEVEYLKNKCINEYNFVI